MLNQEISICDIVTTNHQRSLRPAKVAYLAEKMKRQGYNESYPITINHKGELVDGGHRVAACKIAGIDSVPYITITAGSDINHAIRCNLDGTDTDAYDVFDYAELCSHISAKEINTQLGWSEGQYFNFKNVKTKLSMQAWNKATLLTNNNEFVSNGGVETVSKNLTIVSWIESHFRSFLKELPYNQNNPCRNTMRAQVRAISEIIDRFSMPEKRVTAAYCGEVATKWAWFRKLARDGFDRLSPDVEYSKKREVLNQVYAGKFGSKQDKDMYEKFIAYIDSFNQDVLRLWLVNGRAESLTFLADESVDVIITSPPYNLGQENWPMGGNGRESRDGIGYAAHDDKMEQCEYEAWQVEVLKELYRVAKPGASFFYNHKVRTCDGRLISPMRWLDTPDNPWIIRQEIIWNRKSTHNHAESLFWPIDERIYWMTKGKPVLTQPIGMPTIWEEFGPVPSTWHPAPFTEKLPQMLLEAIHVAPMSVVLDPFSGSGTTVKVALSQQCQAIGVDLTMEYLQKSAEANKWPEKCIYRGEELSLTFGGSDEI